MARTLILGNNPEKWWIKELNNAAISTVQSLSVNRHSEMARYIETLPKDLGCVVIDADTLQSESNELALDIALYVRLMLYSCLHTSLSNIVIVSDISSDSFKGYGYRSMLLMTQNVSLVDSESAIDAVKNAISLTPAEYVEGFLNLLKIAPQEKSEGRHSIANLWGAHILDQIISGENLSAQDFSSGNTSPYFLYSSVSALNAQDVSRIISGNSEQNRHLKISIKRTFNYLLIDDEASKGWDKVLSKLMPQATQDLWDKITHDYNEIDDNIRKQIKSGKYDIIFLDLRMAGVEEENLSADEDFSGIKILRAIKSINPGQQVIMLTATNKAWNVKTFLDLGADGYYMKESPEYHFPLEYSIKNAESLVKSIEDCLKRNFLKDVYNKINRLNLDVDSTLSALIKNHLEISFDLIRKAVQPAEYAYAYIALEQIFELIGSSMFIESNDKDEWIFSFNGAVGDEKSYSIIDLRRVNRKFPREIYGKSPMWVKIAAIYYLLLDGSDEEFISDVKSDIDLRNDYIHENIKPSIESVDYQNLFDTVFELLNLLE